MVDTTNLVSYYKLDESSGTIVDAHGSNDGTSTGITYGQTGKVSGEGAVGFTDATTDKINFGTSAFNFSTSQAWSWSAWINPNLTENTSDNTLFQRIQSSNPFQGYIFQYRYRTGTGSNKRFFIEFNGSGSTMFIAWDHVLTNSTYQHVLLTYDGSGSSSGVNLYVDDVLLTKTTTAGSVSGSYPASIDCDLGGRTGSSNQSWGGDIGSVAIFDKELSSTEARDLYNSGSGLAYPFSASTQITKDGIARLQVNDTEITKTGTARIQIDDTETVYDGIARLEVQDTEITKNGTARVEIQDNQITKTGAADLFLEKQITKDGTARAEVQGIQITKTGNASISPSIQIQKTGNANLLVNDIEITKDGNASIAIQKSITKTGTSRLEVQKNQITKTGEAFISTSKFITKTGNASIIISDTYKPVVTAINEAKPTFRSAETFN